MHVHRRAGQLDGADRLAVAAAHTLAYTCGMVTAYMLMRMWPWQTMDIATLDPRFEKDVLIWINDVSDDMDARILETMLPQKFFPLDPGPGPEDRPTTQRIRVWTHRSDPTGLTLYKNPQTEAVWVSPHPVDASDWGDDWAKRAREEVARMQAEEAKGRKGQGKGAADRPEELRPLRSL